MRVPKLTEEALLERLAALPGWTRQGDEITRRYQFVDFAQAMRFVNRVAKEAEAADHHPDIDIRYNKVTLTLTTHDSGGLTESDIRLAAASDIGADAVGV